MIGARLSARIFAIDNDKAIENLSSPSRSPSEYAYGDMQLFHGVTILFSTCLQRHRML
jgi:hypothetical protein